VRTRGGAGRRIRSQNTARYFLSIEKADRDTEVKSRTTSHYACEVLADRAIRRRVFERVFALDPDRADDTTKRTSYRYSVGG